MDIDFQREANAQHECLLARGYSKTCLRKALKVKAQERPSLIYKLKKATQASSTRIVTKYKRQHGKIQAIYKKFWYLLTADQKINKYIKTYPEITYKRSRSHSDTLVSCHMCEDHMKTKAPGSFLCGKCIYCPHIPRGENILLSDNTILLLLYKI